MAGAWPRATEKVRGEVLAGAAPEAAPHFFRRPLPAKYLAA